MPIQKPLQRGPELSSVPLCDWSKQTYKCQKMHRGADEQKNIYQNNDIGSITLAIIALYNRASGGAFFSGLLIFAF